MKDWEIQDLKQTRLLFAGMLEPGLMKKQKMFGQETQTWNQFQSYLP